MTAARFAETSPDLKGRSVLVIGAGKSGRAAARLVAAQGARVTLADRAPRSELEVSASELVERGIELHGGGHPASLLLTTAAELVVLSPGVPLEIDLVPAAHALGIPVWGEVELAARYTRGRIVGITGSNGKSTVTAMIGAILRRSGIPGGTGGNLDRPLSDLLDLDADDAVYALELSSFQLESIDRFRPAIALLLNLSADHLDRHHSLTVYADAKARIFENQQPADAAILNADDAPSQRFGKPGLARQYQVSTRSEIERGAYLRDGSLMLRTDHGEETLIRSRDLPLPGEHNQSNALFAALATRLGGVPLETIAAGLLEFSALAHRLERVAEVDGVLFFNDSKATNPAATLPALDAFFDGTIHLIVGGKDKGGDWDALVDAAQSSAKRVLVIGKETSVIAARFQGHCEVVVCGTLERAVTAGFDKAQPGDVVLLSPACASFDQFNGFEQRGEAFRQAVAALGGRHA